MKLTRITITEALPVQGLKGIKEFTAGRFPCDSLELTPLGCVLSYTVRTHGEADTSGHLIGIGSAITKCWIPEAPAVEEPENVTEKPRRGRRPAVPDPLAEIDVTVTNSVDGTDPETLHG